MQDQFELATSAGPPAIEVRKLRKTYPGGVEAVRGIDFRVDAGEVFGLLGPNGAGKSTTIGMLTTTITPTSGSANVAGLDVASEPLRVRRASSVVFQDTVLDRGLTGRRNLDIHARLWSVDRSTSARRIDDLARTLGLAELLDRAVAGYSGGERRRLEIARALVSRPQVLFLDEPTVGLDPRIRHELLEVIGRLRDQGRITILLTTHYLDEAERLCDRIAIIHSGQIVALDTPGALLAGLGDELLELRLQGDARPALAMLRAHGIAGEDAFNVGATVTVPLHERAAARVVESVRDSGMAVNAIITRKPTLDDVYLQLTGAHIADAA
jgi:ABC-2 type transport system ATP-binding protein